MAKTITERSEIPDTPYYVLSNDNFMSGWGPATNKTNVVILPCDTEREAEIVATNARDRSDQKRIRIVTTKPRLNNATKLYSLMDKQNASTWYEEGRPFLK